MLEKLYCNTVSCIVIEAAKLVRNCIARPGLVS